MKCGDFLCKIHLDLTYRKWRALNCCTFFILDYLFLSRTSKSNLLTANGKFIVPFSSGVCIIPCVLKTISDTSFVQLASCLKCQKFYSDNEYLEKGFVQIEEGNLKNNNY